MGNPEIGPLAEAVDAMLVGLGYLDAENQGAGMIDGTQGALIIRAAAVMISEAAEAVDDGQQRAYAEAVIGEAFALAKERSSRPYFLSVLTLAEIEPRLQAAVDALVGVHPYA